MCLLFGWNADLQPHRLFLDKTEVSPDQKKKSWDAQKARSGYSGHSQRVLSACLDFRDDVGGSADSAFKDAESKLRKTHMI